MQSDKLSERCLQMSFNSDTYYGYILKGDLHGTIRYIKQFPEQRGLYGRFLDVFEHKQYITYDVD